ncbi:hypothetical protein LPUS_04038 [Lasallia pustulata]|uniref:Integral membrane bound transporter domain-containing protein n=1 Tax=Lasallia pustulata TaxID=136370 RepID=A0A1W5CVZ9_9LECA|nr:hypothetical protein LPUS_04038 [Lasallia pustulata]
MQHSWINPVIASMDDFDKLDSSIIGHPKLPLTYADHPEVVELFLFLHPVRQAADKVKALVQTVIAMDKTRGWNFHLPSYPFFKSLLRANAQVRHDRGGATAGFYFANRKQMEETMQGIQSEAYVPLPRHHITEVLDNKESMGKNRDEAKGPDVGKNSEEAQGLTFRYRLWALLHRFQGFESRFALKVTIVTVLLSIPAWLPQSRNWYNENEVWWSVVTVWIMMHPHVGGNVQDLVARTICCILGAVWGGFAYVADNGNPYVMAVFAALFMIPMLYRYTQSTHPRSGVMGCVSFTVVSLSAYNHTGSPGPFEIAWTRGTAVVVGVVAAVSVNWILWPFVARHELRKSISTMLLHTAIIYRGVVARYIYYTEGDEPGLEDVAHSEMLEGRLREGFREFYTESLKRLRAPFDPLPYSALIDACEHFFERLVEVRQSSLYFQPFMLAGGREATQTLIGVRRDAVAAILMNLYILAGALRSGRPVPRYLPSAAATRKRLLERMEEAEAEHARFVKEPRPEKGRRWADVYQYAYSSALTDIVEQLQQLQSYTKEITGEVGLDAVDYLKPGI